MNRISTILLVLLLAAAGASACGKSDAPAQVPDNTQNGNGGVAEDDENNSKNDEKDDENDDKKDDGKDDENDDEKDMKRLKITIGERTFAATLEDNATARALAALLPLHVRMTEHGGNEKYYDLPVSLPTDTYLPGTIRAGDIMLWGSDCLVLFYKTFQSGYSYTRIGSVDDPAGLDAALGAGSVEVTFAPAE